MMIFAYLCECCLDGGDIYMEVNYVFMEEGVSLIMDSLREKLFPNHIHT